MNYKSSFLKTFMIVMTFIFLFNTAVYSSSLWSDEGADMYKNKKKVYQLGDVVTVLIQESTNAINSANTSVSQGSSVDTGGGLGLLSFLQSFGFTYSDQDDSEGETERSGSISADITTTIVDIYNNGNLKIEGFKKSKINHEEQIIKISGVIRPEDISKENTISSKKLANASIDFEGKGVVAAKQKPNIIQKILNWIF